MTLYAWDVATGKDARDIPPLPANARTLGYSPDARELLLLRKEREIVRWDIQKGKERGPFFAPSGYLSTAALVAEQLLVPQFDGKAVILWDVAQKKKLWSVKATRERTLPGLPMAFSADGKLFAVETPPQVISVYESVSGKRVRRLEGGVDNIYYSLGFSPDARIVAGSNWDGTIRLWDLQSGREKVKISALQGWVTDVYFAPDSKTFATGAGNNAHAVLLWDAATGKPINSFEAHTSPLSCVAFSSDGRTAATCSCLRGDPVVRLWDWRSGRFLQALEVPNGGGVFTVAFSPDGKTLATSVARGGGALAANVRIWDLRTGRVLHTLTGHIASYSCVAFSPDGKRLASGDTYYSRRGNYEGCLWIWDAKSGERLREIQIACGSIRHLQFTPDGRRILAAAEGVHVYDVDTGQLDGEPFHREGQIWDLALSADGRLLATKGGGSNSPVRLWELATRREIPLKLPAGNGYGLALSADGRTLAGHAGRNFFSPLAVR
jgi:WD40 repeat protein